MPYTPQDDWYNGRFWGIDFCDLCGKDASQMQYLDGLWVCSECASGDTWLDECFLCGNVTTVEYSREYDAQICEPCLKMLKGE